MVAYLLAKIAICILWLFGVLNMEKKICFNTVENMLTPHCGNLLEKRKPSPTTVFWLIWTHLHAKWYCLGKQSDNGQGRLNGLVTVWGKGITHSHIECSALMKSFDLVSIKTFLIIVKTLHNAWLYFPPFLCTEIVILCERNYIRIFPTFPVCIYTGWEYREELYYCTIVLE